MKITFPPGLTEALRLTRTGNLAEATALIQATLMGRGAAEPSPPVAVEDGVLDLKASRVTVAPTRAAQPGPADTRVPGSFEKRRYTGAARSLSYRLYIPANVTAGMPLVVMLHGCTQSPEDFARGTGMNRLADELGFLVAYPGQTAAANAQKCWNWFKPGDQRRDHGEPALIAGITREVIASEAADPARVYVAGLSAGGAAAAIMAAAYPDLYAAAGIHSGIDCGAARDLPSALTAMRTGGAATAAPSGRSFVPVITFHGDRDGTVQEINSRKIVAAASAAAGRPLVTRSESGTSPGGGRYTREVSADAAGRALIEQWTVHGAAHAWSGGDRSGSYTDPSGPDASRAMLRFFLGHRIDGRA